MKCAYPPCLSVGHESIRCTRCAQVYYCKRVHQVRDQGRHEAECTGPSTEAPSEPQSALPPGVQKRILKVLLFPPDEDAPRVVETECQIYTDENENQGEEKHEVQIGTTLIGTSTVTAIPIGPIAFSSDSDTPPTRLYLAFNASIQGQSSQPFNRAALGATHDGQPHKPWRGPLVGFRAREPVRTARQFVDVGLQDLPAFARDLNSRAPAPYALTWREMPPDEVLEDIMATIMMEALRRDAQARETRAASATRERPAQATHADNGPDVGLGSQPGPRPERQSQPDEQRARDNAVLVHMLMAELRPFMQEQLAQDRETLRAVIAEQTKEALLTALSLGFIAYCTWRLVVVPVLSLPGMIIRLVDAALSAMLGVVARVFVMLWSVF
ncbi:hypothetical protein GY45DRAFT_1267854 [Cubamyces sp. BRFM 1775]|nr:hypothetical protein GY45DRAFT_1267854 [Cubamyces sp. BRFM 1775]